MNKKPKKSFDAVAESRKWREEASRLLDAMDQPARLSYLAELHAKLPPPRRALPADPHAVATVREDATPYGPSGKEAAP